MSDTCPLVFAVNSGFVISELEGEFDDTVIIAMGCESQYLEDMAQAFIQKGASVYLGWSTVVSLEYVDNATIELLNNLLLKKLPLADGITETMNAVGTDPYFRAYLKYYPTESGDLTLNELIK